MTEIYRSNAAGQIRQAVTMREVAEFYGFTPNYGGFIQCPFHSGDNHGSLKIYPGDRGWHCFGCGAGGDVIDFVMRLFDLPFRDAVARISADFRLNVTDDKPSKKELSERVLARQREAEKKRLAQEEYKEKLRLYSFLRGCADGLSPDDPLYAEAVKALPELEYWLDENIGA